MATVTKSKTPSKAESDVRQAVLCLRAALIALPEDWEEGPPFVNADGRDVWGCDITRADIEASIKALQALAGNL